MLISLKCPNFLLFPSVNLHMPGSLEDRPHLPVLVQVNTQVPALEDDSLSMGEVFHEVLSPV